MRYDMELHRKNPLINKRMETFHKKGSHTKPETPKKKNVHVERLKTGFGIIGGVLARIGSAENMEKLGNFSRNAGEFARRRDAQFAPGGQSKPRKKRKRIEHLFFWRTL